MYSYQKGRLPSDCLSIHRDTRLTFLVYNQGRRHGDAAPDPAVLSVHRQAAHLVQVYEGRKQRPDPAVPHGTPGSEQRKPRGVQQQKVLAAGFADALDEARREPGAGGVLGHKKPPSPVANLPGVEQRVRQRVLQGQPQSAVQHVRVRSADHAAGAHHRRRFREQRRGVEPTERAHQGADRAGIFKGGRRSPETV